MNKILQIIKKVAACLVILIAIVICSGSVGLSVFTFISFGFYASLTLILLAIIRRKLLSLVLASASIICLQLLNQIKVHFYKERLFFSDLYVACDPENFSTLFYYPIFALYLIGLLVFIFWLYYLFRKENKIKNSTRIFCIFLSGTLLATVCYVSAQGETNKKWQKYLPKGRGTISNLFVSANQFVYEAPQYSTSSEYFLEKYALIADKISNQKPEKKPDIVVFLQESTVNPSFFDVNTKQVPEYEMFSQNNSNLMRVQTFGGGTWLTEFSILTGLNTNDFSYRKNSVYYVVAPHVKTSLFKELNDNGYLTVVLSPMGYGNYNAGPAYTSFGMQQFFMPQDIGYPAPKNQNLWKIPSQDILDNAKKLLETYTDKPLFIFVLSMYEHGPYDKDYADSYHLSTDIDDKDFVGRLNDYLSRIEPLNNATLDFVDYINQRNNPTLFLYFGDHQPSLSWRGNYKTTLKNADYLTQYSLLGNYPITLEHDELTDVSLVSGLVLEKAGVNYSSFYKANIAMRYLCNGKLDDCNDKMLVESYKHYIYQDLKAAGE